MRKQYTAEIASLTMMCWSPTRAVDRVLVVENGCADRAGHERAGVREGHAVESDEDGAS